MVDYKNVIQGSWQGMEKFDGRNLRDKVYDVIRLEILEGRLAWGQRIDVRNIADNLRVSTQPIRDAIMRLAQEGLITVQERHGTFVTPITSRYLTEVNQVREMFETFGVSCAPLLTSDLEQLALRLEEMDQVTRTEHCDYMVYNEHDFIFHQTLVELSHNDTMITLYRRLHPHYLYSMILYRYPAAVEQFLLRDHQDHGQIVKYLQRNNRQQAQGVISHHIKRSTEKILAIMEQPPSS